MKIVVHHADWSNKTHRFTASFGTLNAVADMWETAGAYEPVATIECSGMPVEQALEHAFRLTNSIDSAWWEDPRVKAEYRVRVAGARSTSVGDVAVVDDIAYACMAFGWEKIPPQAADR